MTLLLYGGSVAGADYFRLDFLPLWTRSRKPMMAGMMQDTSQRVDLP